MLGQAEYNYHARTRTVASNALDAGRNGLPALQTADADRDAQDRLQHVVVTYDQFRGRRIYVDGALHRRRRPDRGRALLELGSRPSASRSARSRTAAAPGRARSASSRSTSRRSPTRRSSRTTRPASASGCCCASTSRSGWAGAARSSSSSPTSTPTATCSASRPCGARTRTAARIANIQIAVNGELATERPGLRDDRHGRERHQAGARRASAR